MTPDPTHLMTTDPLTGEPWTLCANWTGLALHPHILPDGRLTYAACGGCHKPVTVNDRGVWVYAQ